MKYFFILFLLFTTGTYAQDHTTDWQPWDSDGELQATKIYTSRENVISFSHIIKSTLKLYRKTLSAQDGDNCNFMPSCSNFASEAISKRGVFIGALLAADRLTRCHPLAAGIYTIKGDLLYDPVENYEH